MHGVIIVIYISSTTYLVPEFFLKENTPMGIGVLLQVFVLYCFVVCRQAHSSAMLGSELEKQDILVLYVCMRDLIKE